MTRIDRSPEQIPEEEKPQTITGQGLAAFLRGMFPETKQFDRQIAHIEQEARDGWVWPMEPKP